ncbi:MAG: DUF4198 domain-containing protein [Marinobacter sp.]|nr:DUF4198 domain-containing protein [Marinobacter sp.]
MNWALRRLASAAGWGLACSFFVFGNQAMADIGKVCVFSEVTGVIRLQGQPVEGATVVRTHDYRKAVSDQATTDADGAFAFPAAFERAWTSILPIELVIAQRLTVSYQGQDYLIWSNTKRSKAENTELGGLPLTLTCELTDELRLHREFGSILRTNCVWSE